MNMYYYIIMVLTGIGWFLLYRLIKTETKLKFVKSRSLRRTVYTNLKFSHLSETLSELIDMNTQLEENNKTIKSEWLVLKTNDINNIKRRKNIKLFMETLSNNSESIFNTPGLFQFQLFIDYVKLIAVITAFDKAENIHTFEVYEDTVTHEIKPIDVINKKMRTMGLEGSLEGNEEN